MPTPPTRPADLIRATWAFNLQKGGVNTEVAEFDIWWQIVDSVTPASWTTFLTEFAQQMYDGWKLEFTPALFPASVIFRDATARRCDSLGHTVDEIVYTPTSSIWGGASGNSLPWQLSDCVGLYSYEPSGFVANARRKRGRIYLPPMQSTDAHDPDTGELQSSVAGSILESVNNLIWDQEQFSFSGPPTVVPGAVVLSLGPYTTSGAPAVYPVTWLRNDTVWDTQRRRRKSLVPTVVQGQILSHLP